MNGTFCEPETAQRDPVRFSSPYEHETTVPATAPLYQFAAAHDGLAADLWLLAFYRVYGWLD